MERDDEIGQERVVQQRTKSIYGRNDDVSRDEYGELSHDGGRLFDQWSL